MRLDDLLRQRGEEPNSGKSRQPEADNAEAGNGPLKEDAPPVDGVAAASAERVQLNGPLMTEALEDAVAENGTEDVENPALPGAPAAYAAMPPPQMAAPQMALSKTALPSPLSAASDPKVAISAATSPGADAPSAGAASGPVFDKVGWHFSMPAPPRQPVWDEMPAINRFFAVVGSVCLLLAFGRATVPSLAASARRAYYPYTAAGRQESCLNNLRSLSMALAAYAQDNDGRYPFLDSQDAGQRRVTWVSILTARAASGSPGEGAVPNQLLCPAGPAVPGRGAGTVASYGMNPVLAAAKSQEVEDPAAAVLLADRGAKHDVALLPPYPSWPAYNARSAGSGFDPAACNFDFRHRGQTGDAPATGVAYADGHAGTLTPGDWAMETSAWGGSAVLRLARDRLLRRRPETSALLQRLQADDLAGSASYLSGHRAALKPVSGDVLALWRLNGGEHASAGLDRLGWNLAQAWRLAGDAALERQCDAEETRRCQAEWQRTEGKDWDQKTTQGQPAMSCLAPNAWTLENEQEGRYRRLYFRSSIPALYALIEVGTRSAFITPQPIHWDGDERDLQRRYGIVNYRRLAMTTGSLQGHEAGLWEYEVQKPGGPRLHKRLLGYTDGWNSYVVSTTAPARDWARWQPAFDKLVDSAQTALAGSG